jgi:hypothetical protein
MKCSICNREIPVEPGGWAGGHNAEPINKGRCCDECNDTVVVPARLRQQLLERGRTISHE